MHQKTLTKKCCQQNEGRTENSSVYEQEIQNVLLLVDEFILDKAIEKNVEWST